MILKDLINKLEAMDQNAVVDNGFSTPHSDRGDYSELAFHPEETAKVSDMLKYAKSALGATFTGWKGGEFKMGEYTPVHIGEYGTCGEEINSAHFRLWEISEK